MGKKQKNCDPNNPDDDHQGDSGDHVAYDPEHRLVLAVIPGARTIENAEAIVAEVTDRLGDEPPRLITTDESAAYETAMEQAFGPAVDPPDQPTPGRPRIAPERRLPQGLSYATVHQERKNNRVVKVEQKQVFGTRRGLASALRRAQASRSVTTSFGERNHGTDRGRNARKSRRTYRFSKDWEVHEAVTFFTM